MEDKCRPQRPEGPDSKGKASGSKEKFPSNTDAKVALDVCGLGTMTFVGKSMFSSTGLFIASHYTKGLCSTHGNFLPWDDRLFDTRVSFVLDWFPEKADSAFSAYLYSALGE